MDHSPTLTDYLTAWGTVGLGALALFSSALSLKLYFDERRRRKEESDAYERREAGLVMAWMGGSGDILTVHNGSNVPMTNCVVHYRTHTHNLPPDGAGGAFRLMRSNFLLLPANSERKVAITNADSTPGIDSPVHFQFSMDSRNWYRDRQLTLHSLGEGRSLADISPELKRWAEEVPEGPLPLSDTPPPDKAISRLRRYLNRLRHH